MIVFYWLDLILSALVSILRFGVGRAAAPASAAAPLILYEFEGCPYCRIAREAISETGASVLVRPCPKRGRRFRLEVKEKGGKTQFPLLIDPNTDQMMYESADISRYLFKSYGGSARPALHYLGPINVMLSSLGVLLRLARGTFVLRAHPPAAPPTLFGAERDPAARLVRETLSSMEIEYLWRPRGGRVELVDGGEAFSGAREIRKHLRSAYRA